MKNTLKNISIISVLAASMAVSGQSLAAGSCGEGKILEIKEGGWNTDDLIILLDYSSKPVANEHVDTLFSNKYTRFRASRLSPERLRAIRALAYLAMVGEHYVGVWSHANGCDDSTEINLLDDSIVVPQN